MYQIYVRKGTTEYALMILFEVGLMPRISLSQDDKLAGSKVPITFIYGDEDWVKIGVDGYAPEKLLRDKRDPCNRIHILPDCGHTLHMDNPYALANCLLNELVHDKQGD